MTSANPGETRRWAALHAGHEVRRNARGAQRCVTCATGGRSNRTADDGIVDRVVIERLLAGWEATAFTAQEQAVAVHRMDAAGVSRNEIARRLGLSGRAMRDILRAPEPVETYVDESDQVDELDEDMELGVAA